MVARERGKAKSSFFFKTGEMRAVSVPMEMIQERRKKSMRQERDGAGLSSEQGQFIIRGGAQSAGAHTQVAGVQVPAATASVFSGNGEARPAAEKVGGGV